MNIPTKYLVHFALLIEEAHILLSDHITPQELDVAEQFMKQFHKDFEGLCGSYNIIFNLINL